MDSAVISIIYIIYDTWGEFWDLRVENEIFYSEFLNVFKVGIVFYCSYRIYESKIRHF